MAEIALGVVGAAAAAVSLAKALYQFAETIKDAKDQIHDIARNIDLFSHVLDILGDSLTANSAIISENEKAQGLLKDICDGCEELFERIWKHLPKAKDGNEGPNLGQKFQWPFKQEKARVLVAEIEHLKSTTSVLLEILIFSLAAKNSLKATSQAMYERAMSHRYLKAKTAILENDKASLEIRKVDLKAEELGTQQWAASDDRAVSTRTTEKLSNFARHDRMTRTLTVNAKDLASRSEGKQSVIENSDDVLKELLKQLGGLNLDNGSEKLLSRLKTLNLQNTDRSPRLEHAFGTAKTGLQPRNSCCTDVDPVANPPPTDREKGSVSRSTKLGIVSPTRSPDNFFISTRNVPVKDIGINDYLRGYGDGQRLASRAYERGRKTGYGKGYTEGRNEVHTEGYNKGRTAGYNKGRTAGYNKGRTEGYNEGRTEGYNEGRTEGYNEGRTEGYNEGHTEGYEKGEEAGRAQGHEAGREEGQRNARMLYCEGCNLGRSEGKDAGPALTKITQVRVISRDEDGTQRFTSYERSATASPMPSRSMMG